MAISLGQQTTMVHQSTLIETQFQRKVRHIRCDNEFTQDSAFVEFCENKGIIMEPRPPYDSNQNAKAERRIQSIMNMTRSTLDATEAPNTQWGECILACHLISNIVPTKANLKQKTAWQSLHDFARLVHDPKMGMRSIIQAKRPSEPTRAPIRAMHARRIQLHGK